MTDRPILARRYVATALRDSYVLGWHQMCDHDGLALLDRFSDLDLSGQQLAAALFGAADALAEVAARVEAAAVADALVEEGER